MYTSQHAVILTTDTNLLEYLEYYGFLRRDRMLPAAATVHTILLLDGQRTHKYLPQPETTPPSSFMCFTIHVAHIAHSPLEYQTKRTAEYLH